MTAPALVCPAALDIYDRALSLAATGRRSPLILRGDDGREARVDAAQWCLDRRPGDDGLLRRCAGATLDIGCGPGRLTAALLRLGRAALGIDVSAAAVRLARQRGATALRRDVFAPLPGHGRWEHLLLADGNLGIGGDPAALLRRCRELLAPTGRLHVELEPPGSGSWSGVATLHDGGDGPGAPLSWARVAADDLDPLARPAGLRTVANWTEEGRWFASLTPDERH
ncbi:class I SAM-dependent methyltransferase [Actinoplanes oblitus]|uniref:Class I SAM-dependent methyltransferase n=1 Tax=Actinoplanes oblitus TaxID=3040509 RepID=A0ABY8W5C8_9ACTN|nr:class I SAM-dependent methyltransferase [Actinoplanes oblitus]WIM93054.1 class I SAM-dependent methyltransferase [Actinoplanes oblitus]